MLAPRGWHSHARRIEIGRAADDKNGVGA
jgi:hypothetical protein